jgi:hypothetical protein
MTLEATPTSVASRRQRLVGPLLTGGAVLATTVALHFRDPHQHGSWGLCPLYALTGIYCPGCGALRATNDLSDGHLWQAASSNLLFVALIPLIVFGYLRWVADAWNDVRRTRNVALQRNLGIVLLGLMAVFTLARNLPFGTWLAP